MPESKTPGQVAYEAWNKSKDFTWWKQPAEAREHWESIAQAVYAYYETGIPGAK